MITLKTVVERAVKRARAEQAEKDKTKKDDDLEAFMKEALPTIKVVGAGGAGNNTIARLHEMGIKGAELIAVNTDAQQLVYTPADRKILIGKRLLKGLGAGSDPRLGEQATQEDIEEIKEALKGADLVFVTAGLGGGTGSGSAPVIAETARELGALTVAVVTLPFSSEGRVRLENAITALAKLLKTADTIIIIPNDKLLEIAPDLPINAAFKVSDEILANAIKGITEMITKPGLINLDFNDLKTVLAKGGPAVIGMGESQNDGAPEDRALEAVENALASPLLDVDISDATKALVNVVGGADMTLKEAEMIAEAVASKIHPHAHIIWGAMIDPELPKNMIQTMVVISGGKIPYLQELQEIAEKRLNLDIDFVE
ncbi:MAG TPA: cell division protein FtsZ [Euryarchaeota archaeon]|nr:cell division protein FtsZ [Euryarchaeota archaeon]